MDWNWMGCSLWHSSPWFGLALHWDAATGMLLECSLELDGRVRCDACGMLVVAESDWDGLALGWMELGIGLDGAWVMGCIQWQLLPR